MERKLFSKNTHQNSLYILRPWNCEQPRTKGFRLKKGEHKRRERKKTYANHDCLPGRFYEKKRVQEILWLKNFAVNSQVREGERRRIGEVHRVGEERNSMQEWRGRQERKSGGRDVRNRLTRLGNRRYTTVSRVLGTFSTPSEEEFRGTDRERFNKTAP